MKKTRPCFGGKKLSMKSDNIKTMLVCKYSVTERNKQTLEGSEYNF